MSQMYNTDKLQSFSRVFFSLWLAITNITYVDNDGVGVAGVRADDKLGIIIGPTLHNEVMKLVTKQVLARIVHVVAVTDHRHDAFRKPRQHVAVCFPFTITCPSRHCTTQSHTPSPYYTITHTHAVTVLHNHTRRHCTAQSHTHTLSPYCTITHAVTVLHNHTRCHRTTQSHTLSPFWSTTK